MDRWRHEYVVNLRETQRTSKLNINSLKINVNDIVLVFYEKVPRHFWRIAIVTRVLPSRDSEIRGAIVRIAKTNTILKRPVNKLFAIKNICYGTKQTDKASHKEIASLLPCCPANCEYSRKKTQMEKKANSALNLRTDFRSMMGEERLNALSFVCIHRNIFLVYDEIINIYSSKYPRKILLINPLSEN